MCVTRPTGFRAAACKAGIKPSGRPDLAMIVNDGSRRSAAAVFTRNVVVGAPVEIGRRWRERYLGARGVDRPEALRAILINAGCSNAATGQAGIEDAMATMRAAAGALGCAVEEIMPSSTGIIGHRLPVEKMTSAMPGLAALLARGHDADDAVAAAIMTTDLVPKASHREVELRGHQVHLGAVAKGSGMIAPRLDSAGDVGGFGAHGTMLAFITTDAAIDADCLQIALERACRESFDRVSVDAHPSCSDTVICMSSGMVANGKGASAEPIHRSDPEFFGFQSALTSLCQELATKVVKDGEGATRTFRVEVRGAASHDVAERLARAVIDSPLVKCAIHGKDPNWGRIVTAAGNAGVRFDPMSTSLTLSDGHSAGVEVYRAGLPTGVSKTDPRLIAAMNADPVCALLTVGEGPGHAHMLGCDLSAEYVKINAEYTT